MKLLKTNVYLFFIIIIMTIIGNYYHYIYFAIIAELSRMFLKPS